MSYLLNRLIENKFVGEICVVFAACFYTRNWLSQNPVESDRGEQLNPVREGGSNSSQIYVPLLYNFLIRAAPRNLLRAKSNLESLPPLHTRGKQNAYVPGEKYMLPRGSAGLVKTPSHSIKI